MEETATELFLKYNYPETKELCIRFLTIIISVLVFSITFSEKIIDYKTSSKFEKSVLVLSWVLLIVSIILCGIGLTLHTIAGGQAVYGTESEMYRIANIAYRFIVISGGSFILGLILITLSGILNIKKNKKIVILHTG